MRMNTTTRTNVFLPKMMALVLAATLPVACTSIPGGLNSKAPGSQQAPTAQQQPTAATPGAKAETANDAQTASQVQRDMDDSEMMADSDSGFATQALPSQLLAATARAVVRAELQADTKAAIQALSPERKQKLVQHALDLQAKCKTRLKATTEAFKKGVQKTVTENDLGGKTVSLTFEFTGKGGVTRSGSMERIFNADKVLVSAKHVEDWKGPNGNVRHMERTKILQADGSYAISGTATFTVNGKTRTCTWTKTLSAEGGISGTGTITRFDGKTVTITFGGKDDKETCTAKDPAGTVTATVEASAEAGAATTATVTDAANSTTQVQVDVDANLGADASTSTSGSTAASGSTSASGTSSGSGTASSGSDSSANAGSATSTSSTTSGSATAGASASGSATTSADAGASGSVGTSVGVSISGSVGASS